MSKENEADTPPPKQRKLYDSDYEDTSKEEYDDAIRELQGSGYGKMFSFIYLLHF